MVKLWREDLGKVNQKAAEALADPAQYANLFPNMQTALKAEQQQVPLQPCLPAPCPHVEAGTPTLSSISLLARQNRVKGGCCNPFLGTRSSHPFPRLRNTLTRLVFALAGHQKLVQL